MIPSTEIQRECDPNVLSQAKALAAQRANFRSAVVRTNDIRGVRTTEISAGVRSSTRERYYKAMLLVDEGVGELVDYSCTCDAAYNFSGMCKHAAALALLYNNQPEAFMGYAGKQHARTSSSALLELMGAEAQRLAGKQQEQIELIPTLRYYFGRWDLSFKVASEGASYVLKSIDDFVSRMKRGEYHSYGKKLGFVHNPDCLTPKSQKVFRFLQSVCTQRSALTRNNGGVYASSYGFGGGACSGARTARELMLTEAEVVQLLEIFAGSQIDIQNDEQAHTGDPWLAYVQPHGVPLPAPVIEGAPDLGIQIRTAEDGFSITPPPPNTVLIESPAQIAIMANGEVHLCGAEALRACALLRALIQNDGLFVASEDAPLFCSTLLDPLRQAFAIAAPKELLNLKPPTCELKFYFDVVKGFIECEALAVYGEESYPLSIAGANFAPANAPGNSGKLHALARSVRNYQEEANAARLLASLMPEGRLDVHNGEMVGPLLFGGLAALKQQGEVFTTPAFDRLIFSRKATVSADLTIAGNLINLNIASNELAPDEVAAVLSSYRAQRHYHRLRSGAYLNIAEMDQDQLKRLSSIANDLGLSAKALANGAEVPIYQAFYLNSVFEDECGASLQRYVQHFDAARKKHQTAPRQLKGSLRPYQKEGFAWLSTLSDCGFGGILADEMGLGKSVQLIAWLLSQKQALHRGKASGEHTGSNSNRSANECATSLIVCPASLIYNWIAEFKRFAPRLKIATVDGGKSERTALLAQASNYDVLVASYDIVRIDVKEFAAVSLFSCVLDEAQFIKNRSTKAARAVKRVRALHRFALTGTPIENKPGELWSIFDFLMPGFLGSPMHFRESFEIPLLGNDEDAAARLRKLIGPFILRRTKQEVLAELPEKNESALYVKLGGEQERLYRANEQNLRDRLNTQKKRTADANALRYKPVSPEAAAKMAAKRKAKRPVLRPVDQDIADREDMSKVEVLAEITRLRQLCLDPSLVYENYHGGAAKLPAIVDMVEQAAESGVKTLVFSQFTSFLARIANELSAAGISYLKLTGSTPAKKRLEMVDAFNNNDTPAFLISLRAGGTGLNLTGATLVILADPWWNAAVQNQASDRAHRIGQTRNVNVVKVVAQGTIEERIVALQETKQELASMLVDGNASTLTSLTADDVIDLLS